MMRVLPGRESDLHRRAFLVAGAVAPLLYAIADVATGRRLAGYSFRDHTISELGAIGAPSRPLFSVLLTAVYLLMLAFAVGIWKSAGLDRRLRTVGVLLAAVSIMALTVGQFAAMRLRGTDQGSAGALHLIEGMVAMIMIFAAMGIAATALGRQFRVYTVVTLAVAFGFGAWAAMEVGNIEQGLPTPWVGVKERIFWYAYQSWYIGLALALLRRPPPRPA